MSFPFPPDDRDNPYAPPSAQIGGRGFDLVSSPLVMVPFTVEGVMSHSWMVFKDRLGICLGLFWAPMGMLYAMMGTYMGLTVLVRNMAGRDSQAILTLMGLVAYVLIVGFSIWVNIGMSIAFLKVARMQEARFSDLFSGGRLIWTTLFAGFLTMLLVYAAMFACVIPFVVAGGALRAYRWGTLIAGIFGGACFVVGFLAVTTRIAPLSFVIADRGPGAIGAIRQTFRITEGHTWKIALFFLLFMAIYVAGFLACGVGLVFAMPFLFLTFAVTYVAMAGTPVGGLPGVGPGDFPMEPKPYSDADFGGLA